MNWELLYVQALNGLSNGAIYFLFAIGFTIVYGLMDFVNFAHGAFYVVAAFAAYSASSAGLSFWAILVLVPAGVTLSALILEKFFFQKLYRRSHAVQIVITLGFALAVEEIVTLIYGPYLITLPQPHQLAFTVQIGHAVLPAYRVFVFVLVMLLAFGLYRVLKSSRLGATIRAGAEDREALETLGVNFTRVAALAFGLGAGLAALAGVLDAPLRAVDPSSGIAVFTLAIVVVVVGKVGSYSGAFVAAFAIAQVQSMSLLIAPELSEVAIYATLVGVLALRRSRLHEWLMRTIQTRRHIRSEAVAEGSVI